MTEYKITCYCYNCNGGNVKTKSGEDAKEGYTVACHPNKYNALKDKRIKISGIEGYRYIKDVYSKNLPENIIDVYVGNTGSCKCNSHHFNRMRTVTFE